MSASVRSAASAAASTGNVVVTKPSGTADGDLLVAIAWADDTLTNPTAPAGWTQQGTTQSLTGVGVGKVYRKTASSEGSSYTWTGGGYTSVVIMFAITGHDTTTPFDIDPSWAGSATTSATHTANAVSPAGSDSLLICSFALRNNNNGTNAFSTPTGMTEYADLGDTSNPYYAASADAQALTASGSTGTRVSTSTITERWLAVSFAIKSGASSVSKSGSDSGLGSETGAVTAGLTGSDSGTGSETGQVSQLVSGSDAGTGGESGFVSQLIPGSDTGIGADNGTVAATASGADAGTGAEGGAVTAAVTGSDTGTGSETGFIGISGNDTATGGSSLIGLNATVTGGDAGAGAEGGFVDQLFADLNLSLWAVNRSTGALSPLPDYQSLTVSPVPNAPGAVKVVYPSTGTNYNLLHNNVDSDCDLEVEIWLSGSNTSPLRGYLQETSVDDTAEPPVATFSGSFLEIRMAEAVVFPQVAPLGNDKLEAQFSAATAGAIMATFLSQAQARGSLTDITKDFTGTTDSRGVAWPSVVTAKFSPSTTYQSVLDTLVKLGLCEWWISADHVLHLVVSGGRGADRTTGPKPVILRRGRNISTAPRKHSVRASATTVLAAGSQGVYQSASDASALSRRGRRIEVSASATNISDTSAVLGFAQTELAAVSPGLMEVTHGLGFLPGEPRPGLGFGLGDWIFSDINGTLSRLRVSQWTLTVGGSSDATPDGSVTLNDLTSDAVTALQRKLANMANGSTVVGTSTSTADTSTPTPPTSLTAASVAYIDGTLGARAAVTVGWTPPTTNVDGTTLNDLAGYNVQYALATSPTVWNAGITVSNGSAIGGTFAAPAGVTIAIQVDAFDQSGNTSAWSASLPHTTANDVTAPSVTSTPVMSDFLGTVRTTWDGLTSTGIDMNTAAPDFDHVDVHLSTGSLFTPSTATLVGRLFGRGTYTVADLPYGVAQFGRLVAVDGSGNQSGPSTQASATPSQVGTGDVGDGAISTAKIQNLAVTDAQIGSASVGKLTTGVFTADMTLSGSIKTATSGNRVEIDSAGVRLYNGTNVVVNLKTSDGSALVVGEFRTSLSGQRIVFNPGGALADTMNFYPSAAGDFARIMARTAPLDGTAAILIDGGAANGTGRGRVGAYKSEAFISYVSNDAGGDTTAGFSRTAVSCNSDNVVAWAQSQFLWSKYSGSSVVSASTLRLTFADGDTSSNQPVIGSPSAGTAVKFDGGFVLVTNSTGDSFAGIKANGFVVSSGQDTKTDIEPLDESVDALAAVRAAKGRRYRYRSDVARHGSQARHRVGVLAEEMPEDLVTSTPAADGSGTEKSLNLADWLGLAHTAIGQHADETDTRFAEVLRRLDTLEGRRQ